MDEVDAPRWIGFWIIRDDDWLAARSSLKIHSKWMNRWASDDRNKRKPKKRKKKGFFLLLFSKDISAALSHYHRDLASRLRSMDVSYTHNPNWSKFWNRQPATKYIGISFSRKIFPTWCRFISILRSVCTSVWQRSTSYRWCTPLIIVRYYSTHSHWSIIRSSEACNIDLHLDLPFSSPGYALHTATMAIISDIQSYDSTWAGCSRILYILPRADVPFFVYQVINDDQLLYWDTSSSRVHYRDFNWELSLHHAGLEYLLQRLGPRRDRPIALHQIKCCRSQSAIDDSKSATFQTLHSPAADLRRLNSSF